MASLYRFDSFPPVQATEFIDIENHAPSLEDACGSSPWAVATAPPTGLADVNVACALRPRAFRVTCNGGMLSPEQQVQQVQQSFFVRCGNDLPSAAASEKPIGVPGCPSFASITTPAVSPFGVPQYQLPANGPEAGMGPVASELGVFSHSTSLKAANYLDLVAPSGPGPVDADFLGMEVPASPARRASEGALKALSSRGGKAGHTAEEPEQQPDLPRLLAVLSALLPVPSCAAPDQQPALSADTSHDRTTAALVVETANVLPHAAPPASTALANGQCAPASSRLREQSAPLPPTLSCPSSVLSHEDDEDEADSESGCDSGVVKRHFGGRAHVVASAGATSAEYTFADAGAASDSAAEDAEAGLVAGPQPAQGAAPRGQKRRAAAAAAVKAATAAREWCDGDDDEDYDANEWQGERVNRAPKRVKKAGPPRANPGKARSDVTCRNCRATVTPQWRCGPEGPRTLCNACGVRYKKGKPLAYMEKKRQTGA